MSTAHGNALCGSAYISTLATFLKKDAVIGYHAKKKPQKPRSTQAEVQEKHEGYI